MGVAIKTSGMGWGKLHAVAQHSGREINDWKLNAPAAKPCKGNINGAGRRRKQNMGFYEAASLHTSTDV